MKKSLFVVMVLLSLPMVSAEFTEIETRCDDPNLFECYTILKADPSIPNPYLSKEYDTDLTSKSITNLPNSELNMPYKTSIKDMKIKILNSSYIKISGRIDGSTNNYWGIKILGDISFWGSTWWNSTFLKKESFNVTNGLSMARTNVTVIYNQSKDNTTTDCSDIRIANSTDNGEFTQWNITNTVDYCTIRLYDNFTSEEVKFYYIYYGNSTPVSKPAYLNSNIYETLWRWNEIDGTEFTELQDESTRNLTRAIDGSSIILGVYQEGTSGGTTVWNITAIDPNINLNDIFYFHYENLWNGSQSANGLVSNLHRMGDLNNFYDFFTYTQNAGGGCAYGIYIRNKTGGSYNTPIACYATVPAKGLWYEVVGYLNPATNFLYSSLKNSTALYETSITTSAVLGNNSLGLRYYAGNPQGVGYVELIKNLEIGTLLTNRNISINAGDEEQYTTTSTTTSSTTTMPMLYVDLSNPANNSEFEQYVTFTMNGTVNCSDAGGCGFATIWAKYDSSFMGAGESLVASNFYPCVDCTPESPCFPTWTVNGTETGDYNIYIYANTSDIENTSTQFNISIFGSSATTSTTSTTTSSTTTTPATTTTTIPTYSYYQCWNETFHEAGNKTFYYELPKQYYLTYSALNLSGFGYEYDSFNETFAGCVEEDVIESYNNTFWLGDMDVNQIIDEEWMLINLSGKTTKLEIEFADYSEAFGSFYDFNYSVWICPTLLTNFTSSGEKDSSCLLPYQLVRSSFDPERDKNYTFDTPYYGNTSSYEIIKFNTTNSSDGDNNGDYIFYKRYNCSGTYRTIAFTDLQDDLVYQDTLPPFSYFAEQYPENVSLDVSGDGDYDYTNATMITQKNLISGFESEINEELYTCTADDDNYCNVPFVLHSDTRGIIEVCALNYTFINGNLDDCTNFNNTLLTMHIYNETTNSSMNATVEGIFDLYGSDGGYLGNYSHKFENSSNYTVCVSTDGIYYLDAMLQHYTVEQEDRNYYLRNATVNSSDPEDLSLYLADDTKDIRFEVYDSVYLPVEDAIVKIQKLDISNNKYFTVAMVESDYDGEGLSHLITEDQWYRFIVTDYSGSTPVSYSFTSKQLYYDSSIGYVTVQLVLGQSEQLTYIRDFAYNCTDYRNGDDTVTVRCVFTSTTGLHSSICLEIYNTTDGMVEYSETCSDDVSATLFDILPNSTSTYFYRFIYTDSLTGIRYLVHSATVFVNILTSISYPLFFTFIMVSFIMTTSLLTIYKPAMALLTVPIGVILCAKLFQINIAMGSISALFILSGLVITRLNK